MTPWLEFIEAEDQQQEAQEAYERALTARDSAVSRVSDA
jgi:hypothetical protein